jgi:hypothetical protein
MSDTWRGFFRRLAALCLVVGASAWTSAVCYAQAFDSADDVVYANGWQPGDDGGVGSFGPWAFNGTYAPGIQRRMDDGLNAGGVGSSTFNNLGNSWSLFNPGAADFSRAGRRIGPLAVGQTMRLVIDNPTVRQLNRGYSLNFNTGGGSVCAAGGCTPGTTPTLKYKIERLENANNGQWADTAGPFALFDTDTDAGARIDFTLSSATSYEMKMTPLDNPLAAVVTNGTLANPATTTPIDWIEFRFFNTPSVAGSDTDLFIKSMQILAAPPAVPGDYSRNGTVDAADYVVWRDRLGTNVQLFNEVAGVTPGMVTAEDYTAWKERFGKTSGAGGGIVGASIPEPSTLAYMAGIVCALAGAMNRRSHPSPRPLTRGWGRGEGL